MDAGHVSRPWRSGSGRAGQTYGQLAAAPALNLLAFGLWAAGACREQHVRARLGFALALVARFALGWGRAAGGVQKAQAVWGPNGEVGK